MKTTAMEIIGVESLMPKGVEHRHLSEFCDWAEISVESLMPKGVEHLAIINNDCDDLSCRISDAERR